MSKQSDRKLIKTKFEGVFYRLSTKKDPRTGEPDRVYYFWFADAAGKGHWKAVGRHSKGERPQSTRIARSKYLNELAAGNNPAVREKVTVGDAVDAYVTWARAEGKHVDKPLQQYDKHMRARLHSVPINAVTAAMLTRIKADLTNTAAELKYSPTRPAPAHVRPLSAQTIAHQFSFLRRAIYRAISCDLWSGSNPFASRKGGAFQMPRVDNHRLRFFTPAEATALLAKLLQSSQQLHDMAMLSLKTGMRATEIFKLRAQDINAHAAILHVRAKGGTVQAVHAPRDVIRMLLSYGRTGAEPIFQERGTGGEIKRISDAFTRAVAALGLDNSNGNTHFAVTFHTLRHTFASWLAQSGQVTLIELKTLMRHESLAMTQRYAHLIPGEERKKLSIIDKLLKGQ